MPFLMNTLKEVTPLLLSPRAGGGFGFVLTVDTLLYKYNLSFVS